MCPSLVWLEAGAVLAQALSNLGTRCQERLTLVLAEAWWQSHIPPELSPAPGAAEEHSTASHSPGRGDPFSVLFAGDAFLCFLKIL